MKTNIISVWAATAMLFILTVEVSAQDSKLLALMQSRSAQSRLASLQKTCDQGKGSEDPFNCMIQNLEESLVKLKRFFTETPGIKNQFRNVRMWLLVPSFTARMDTMIRTYFDSPTIYKLHAANVEAFNKKIYQHALKAAVRDPYASSGYTLPLDEQCANLPTRYVPELSIKRVCATMASCASTPYNSAKSGCTSDGMCDVQKALPLMLGVLNYKIGFAFTDKFCNNRCPGPGGCNMNQIFAEIANEVELLKTFITTLPGSLYEKFYRDAWTRKAYSDLNAAMLIVSENEHKLMFSRTSTACKKIEFKPACHIASIYQAYSFLKKLKIDRQRPVKSRDLRLQQNIDHAKMLNLKQNALRHFELLNTMGRLDDNLRASVKGIASYFKGTAEFDEGIANADVLFIQTKLAQFDEHFKILSKKLAEDTNAAMSAMDTILRAEFVEQTAKLIAKIAQNCNPLKAIFSGIDATGILEQTGKVAAAVSDLAKGISLVVHLPKLARGTIEIANDLKNNAGQLSTLESLVKKIKKNEVDKIGDDAEKFIEEYSNYDPKVGIHRMAGNIALWSAYSSSTCDLLNGVEGIAGNVGTAVVGGMLLCEKLQGTIAEFDALRENMFSFQFELIDSLARVVRGVVSKKLASSIQNEHLDLLNAGQLLAGFLMAQNQLQTHALLYCDKLEYKNAGRNIKSCQHSTRLFSSADELDKLVAYTDNRRYTSVERTVYIPSKPQFPDDLGFISIASLAKEKTATFKLPLNKTWLYENEWSLLGESEAPFVESFQLFLPRKQHKKTTTSTRVTLTADSGSYISLDSPVVYKLPEQQTSYVTVYRQGHRSSTCNTEILNPYSLCGNLPKICQESTAVASGSCSSTSSSDNCLLPTTASRWRVSFTIQSGAKEIPWAAPTSATTLYFIAKLRLRMYRSGRQHSVRKPLMRVAATGGSAATEGSAGVCCRGNTYHWSLRTSTCRACPVGSRAKLGGYYLVTSSTDYP